MWIFFLQVFWMCTLIHCSEQIAYKLRSPIHLDFEILCLTFVSRMSHIWNILFTRTIHLEFEGKGREGNWLSWRVCPQMLLGICSLWVISNLAEFSVYGPNFGPSDIGIKLFLSVCLETFRYLNVMCWVFATILAISWVPIPGYV